MPLPLIPEILHLICENISDKPTLARLARTCKTFKEPALDMLWKDLHGFYDLAKFLPEYLVCEFTRETEQGNQRVITLLCDPQLLPNSDCKRLLHYAEKVKTFRLDQHISGKDQVDISIFQGIYHALSQNVAIFPKLQKLFLLTGEEMMFPLKFAYLLAGPRLTVIDIMLCDKAAISGSIFSDLPKTYPSLMKVKLRSFYKDKKETDLIISRSLCDMEHWHNLKHLHVPNLTYEALLRVSQLHLLETLQIERYKPEDNLCAKRGAGFTSLRNLIAAAVDIHDIIPLIEMLDSTPLQMIRITLGEAQTGDSYRHLCNTVRDHVNHETLTIFYSTDIRGISEESPEVRPLTYEDIKPLLSFHNLEELIMELTYGAYFSGAEITNEMASKWRNIETLAFRLAVWSTSLEQSTITLNDLIPFASCPNLENLDFFFDAQDPPVVDPLPVHGIVQSKLESLGVNDSPAQNEFRISAFLKKYFPKLECVQTGEDRNSKYDGTEDGEFKLSERERVGKLVEELL